MTVGVICLCNPVCVALAQVANSWRYCSVTRFGANRHIIVHPRSHAHALAMAVCFLFRFSSPLTVTLRRLTPVTYSPWVPSSKRMFLRSAPLQKPFSGPETSRHSESAAQTRQNHEAHSSCQCRRQDKSVNKEYDQGLSRLPFLDATLTAIMGIGIGEPQLWTGHFVLFPFFTTLYGRLSKSHAFVPKLCDVGPIFTKIRWVSKPKPDATAWPAPRDDSSRWGPFSFTRL